MMKTVELDQNALAVADMVMILSSGHPDISLHTLVRMVICGYLAADGLDEVPVMALAQQAMQDQAAVDSSV